MDVRELYQGALEAIEAGDQERGEGMLESALAAARSHGDEPGELRCLFAIGHQHERFARLDEARAAHLELIARAEAAGRRDLVCAANQQLGVVAIKADDLDEAERRLEVAFALATDLGDHEDLAYVQQERGFLALCRHEPVAAIERFREAERHGRAIDRINVIGNARYGIGAASLDIGEVAAGARALADALDIKVEVGDDEGVHVVALRAAIAAIAAGDRRGRDLLAWACSSPDTAGAIIRYDRDLIASAGPVPSTTTIRSIEEVPEVVRSILSELPAG